MKNEQRRRIPWFRPSTSWIKNDGSVHVPHQPFQAPRLILLAWPGPRSQQNKNCKRLHFNTLEQFSFWQMKSFDACSNSNAFVTLSIWSRDYYLNNDLLELFILRLILLLLAAGSLGPQTNTEKGCILYSWTILFRGIKSSTHNLMLTTVSLLWFSFSEASLPLLRLGPQVSNK